MDHTGLRCTCCGQGKSQKEEEPQRECQARADTYLSLYLTYRMGHSTSISEETESQGTSCSSLKVTADSQTTGTWDSMETERKKLQIA